ncbi:MAG: sigma-70 family RNA polymerase sigma factor [Vicinamibacteria bacterium]|nr:sigma-70 family RNA polymerase sigma factor [Vicinamibacteria bacterium]
MAAGEFAIATVETLGAASAERSLLEQCRGGDAAAFARLVALHETMVFNLALRMLGNPDEARDVSQDVFLQVYRTLGRFEERSSLRTWIYRIVVNLCRNRRRLWMRRRRDRSVGLEDLSARDESRLAQGGDSPYDTVRRREQAERVQRALLALSFDHRAVLVLREVEGLTCEEIAHSLGIAEGTVKSRLARARDALRARLCAPEATR